jgi:hypothetical protein
MPTVNVGSILTVDKGRYVDDQVNDLVVVTSVTPTTVAGHTHAWIVTLQSAFTSNYRNGFILTRNRNNNPPLYFIKSVDAAKTTLTVVGDWTTTPPITNFEGSDPTKAMDPPINGNATVTTVNILKSYQWYRDGVAISKNAAAAVYTAQPEDAGKTITVKETATYWDTQNITTVTESAPYNVAAGAVDSKLVFSENIVYLGSFRLQDTQDGPLAYVQGDLGKMMSISSYNGQKSLYIGYNGVMTEYIVPALVDLLANPNLNFFNLPFAQFARPSPNRKFIDPTEGKRFDYGVQGGTGYVTLTGALPIAGNKLLIGSINTYTTYNNSALWTRPQDLTATGQVSGPFYLTDTTSASTNNPRYYSQYTCNIPSTLVNGNNYQTLLGGDVLSGAYVLSIDGNASRGPTAFVWNTSDIAPTLSSKSVTGTIASSQSSGANQHLLGLGASFGFDPTNNYITIINGSGRLQTTKVVGWNNTTKVATVERSGTINTVFPSINITGITLSSPVVLNLSSSPGTLYDPADAVGSGWGATIKNVVGTTQLNNNTYYCRGFTPDGGVPYVELYQDTALTVPVNGASFTPWVSGGTIDVIPSTSSTYQIVPRIDGKMLLGHTEYMQAYAFPVLSGVYSNASGPCGHIIPNGTKSLLYIGTGGDGEWVYSNGAFKFTGEGPLIYDTGTSYSGPHTFPWTTRVWCYNLDDLVAVKNGTRPGNGSFNWDGAFNAPNQLKPYAAFNLTIPPQQLSQFMLSACAYDSATRRIYICNRGDVDFGRVMIHVYEVSNAVAA